MCDICGKKPVFTTKVAHMRLYVSGRSNRKVKPNLRKTTIVDRGVKKQITSCTRCMRTMRKNDNKNNLIRQ